MKRTSIMLAGLLFTLAFQVSARTITIYHTSDVHGWYSARPARWNKEDPARAIGGFPALASTLMLEHQHGTGFGLMSAVDGVGDFLSSITMGVLWTAVSPNAGFAAAGVLALIAAFLLAGLRFSPQGGGSPVKGMV